MINRVCTLLFLCPKTERIFIMSELIIVKSDDTDLNQAIYMIDERLSLKAKGLMALLLAFPDDNDFRLEDISYISKDGIKTIRSALKELEDHRYLVRYQGRDKLGRMYPVEYVIHENPYETNPEYDDDFSHLYDPDFDNPKPTKAEQELQLLVLLEFMLTNITEFLQSEIASNTNYNQS